MPPRWVFTEDMLIHVINNLKEYKSDREGKGYDFESDLIHLYNEVRKKMARIFPDDFGPETPGEGEVDGLDETVFRRQFHDDQKKIKVGYDRIKKKVKTIRSDFAKALLAGRRSGSGKIVKEFWDDLVFLWGGTPGTEALPFGVSTEVNVDQGNGTSDALGDGNTSTADEQSERSITPDSIQLEGFDDISTSDSARNSDAVGTSHSLKRKVATAKFVDDKRKKLSKTLSTCQRESLLLQSTREDIELKKKILEKLDENKGMEAFNKIADSISNLSNALIAGLQPGPSGVSNYVQPPFQPQWNEPRHFNTTAFNQHWVLQQRENNCTVAGGYNGPVLPFTADNSLNREQYDREQSSCERTDP